MDLELLDDSDCNINIILKENVENETEIEASVIANEAARMESGSTVGNTNSIAFEKEFSVI